MEAEAKAPGLGDETQPTPDLEQTPEERAAEERSPDGGMAGDEAEDRDQREADAVAAHEGVKEAEPLRSSVSSPEPSDVPAAGPKDAPLGRQDQEPQPRLAEAAAMPHSASKAGQEREPDKEMATETIEEAAELAEAEGKGGEAEQPPPMAQAEEELRPLVEGDEDIDAFWREEEEPLVGTAPGTTIGERYVIAQVLDAQDDQILYLAHDQGRCWQCGFEGNDPDETFCARCGASLERKPEVRLLEMRTAQVQPAISEPVAARLDHEGRQFLIVEEPAAASAGPAESPAIRFAFGQLSDPGRVRELNEDSMLALTLSPTYQSQTAPVQGLFAVADGMGGHEGGEIASKLALERLAAHMIRAVVLPELAGQVTLEEDILVDLRQATIAANDAVYLARQKAASDMGTTLTTLYIRDDRLFLAHVGDCRAYRWSVDGLEQLTTDHSVVASMIAEGTAAPEEIYTHPHRSVIYRCVGDRPLVEVDTDMLPLKLEDRLVICSDGLWEMIRNEGIEDVLMLEADPQAACEWMVERANSAGGEDNISVIVIQIEGLS
jgi:serine/threonine protein phosphatase PrpC